MLIPRMYTSYVSRKALTPHALGLGKGAVTPLAVVADTNNEVTLIFDMQMLEAGKKQTLLFHPVSGNHMSLEISSKDLLHYVAHFKHTPSVIVFADERVVADYKL